MTLHISLITFSLLVLLTLAQQPTNFRSFPDALSFYTDTLTSRGYTLNLTINHQANAASVNLDLRPTTVFFLEKNKRLAKLLVRVFPTISIDLPQKLLLYQDEKNNILVKTNTPGYLLDRHRPLVKARYPRRKSLCGLSCDFGLKPVNGLVITMSRNSVDVTIKKLREAVLAAGFKVPAMFDYSSYGFGNKVLIFGNPKVGTKLMQNTQEIGIDLPQKFLVYETRDGKVKIVHNDPKFLARRAGIQGLDMVLENVAKSLQNFANTGAA